MATLKTIKYAEDTKLITGFDKLINIRKIGCSNIISDLYKALKINNFSELNNESLKNLIMSNITKIEIAISNKSFEQHILKVSTSSVYSIYDVFLRKIRELINVNIYTQTINNIGVNEFVYIICTNDKYNFEYALNNQRSSIINDEQSNAIKKNIEIRTNQEIIDKTTDTVECPNCHKRRIKFYTKQTRSADEPVTSFYECIDCGNKWTSNN